MEAWQRFKTFCAYWHFQWEIASAMYLMEPAEKMTFHAILFAVLALFLYSAITYWPPYLLMLVDAISGLKTSTLFVEDDV